MLPRSFSTPLIVLTLLTLLTLLTAFSRQQGSAERLAALSTIGVLPTSSFVTAIRQTTGIQTTEALASSLPTLASAPPDLSSSRQALSPSLRSVFNDNKGKAKEVAEKSPTTQEVALLPKRGYRARKPGIWAQCDSYYSIAMWAVRIDQIKEWHVPDDQIETNLRTELKRKCGRGTTGWRYNPPTDDGRGADIRFLTSLLVHHDCVEKAIVAAGGPPIKCRSGKPRPWQGPAAPYIPVIDGPVRTSSLASVSSDTSPATTTSTATTSPS